MTGRKSESQRALEEAFFADHDRQLHEKLRERAALRDRKSALAECSGIRDDSILEQLVQLDIEPATLAALSLVPLVEVAWADGSIADKERAAILAAAADVGFSRGSESYELLEAWLNERPAPVLLNAWKHYVASIGESMSDMAKQAIRRDVLGRAQTIAEAAGGFLGIGDKVSKEERAMLTDLESAFDEPA